MTAPSILPEVLDGAAVGIFGILLSAAFCPIRWTDKKRWALAGCTAGLLALQGVLYFGSSPTAAQYLYPLITHLPLYVVLVLFSGQKVWPLVAVLTAYLCCHAGEQHPHQAAQRRHRRRDRQHGRPAARAHAAEHKMVNAIPHYAGFDAADNFTNFFINHLQDLSIDDIKSVMSVYSANAQCTNRGRHSTDIATINEYIAALSIST